MKLLRLAPQFLRVGHPIPWNVYDDSGNLLLSKGNVIEKESQLESLLERGMYIDSESARIHEEQTARKFNPFWLWDDIHARLGHLLKNASSEDDFPEKVAGLAELIRLIAKNDPDAGIAAMLLVDNWKYPVAHCVHVGILAEMIGQRLNVPERGRTSLVCAALTMNLGMLELQAHLVYQRTPLSDEQKDVIRQHPTNSVALLKLAGVVDDFWLNSVQQHHEDPQGHGYPQGRTDAHPAANILRILDIFCAKVSGRAYRPGVQPHAAIRGLYLSEGQANPIVAHLIKEIGLHPPGSFVKLACGETALVARRGKSSTAPLVFAVVDGKGIPFMEPARRDTEKPEHRIIAGVPREKVLIRLNVPKLWGY